jgi:DNA-directed RNA polymerase specialized sigma24 family protein
MIRLAGIRTREHPVNPYATDEDFRSVFSNNVSELYQLAFLLTADHQKAERSLVSGLEDCVKGNPVFKDWARSWAKRIIVENAIRELKPQPDYSRSSSSAKVFPDQPTSLKAHFGLEALLALPDFNRFVFVMSVLEHFSEHDCSLLLGRSVSEIREARVHALEQLAASRQVIPTSQQGSLARDTEEATKERQAS